MWARVCPEIRPARTVREIEEIIHGRAKAYSQRKPAISVGRLGVTRRTTFPYKVVALGGTFDFFHKGHEQLVSKAFELGQKVIIGITSDFFVRKQGKAHPVQSYTSRVKAVRLFLRSRGLSSRATLAPLRDPYGPAESRKDLEALVITPDTSRSAEKLNQLRTRKGLKPLIIHTVPLFRAADGRPISSTRIRRREIDREGRLVGT